MLWGEVPQLARPDQAPVGPALEDLGRHLPLLRQQVGLEEIRRLGLTRQQVPPGQDELKSSDLQVSKDIEK